MWWVEGCALGAGPSSEPPSPLSLPPFPSPIPLSPEVFLLSAAGGWCPRTMRQARSPHLPQSKDLCFQAMVPDPLSGPCTKCVSVHVRAHV